MSKENEDRLLTIKEASQYLNVSEGTLRNWVFYDKIKSVRVFGAVRIWKSELDKHIKEMN